MARLRDQIDYVFKFADAAAATAAGFTASGQTLLNVTANKISGGTWSGYWVIHSKPAPFDYTYVTATNALQWAMCRGKMNASQRFLIYNRASGDVLDDIRLSPVFAGMKVPWGAIADVPTGEIPASFFGMSTYGYNEAVLYPATFASWPVGTYGKLPGTGWIYIEPFGPHPTPAERWPTQIGGNNLAGVHTLAAADGAYMMYFMGANPGWCVDAAVTINISTSTFSRNNHGLLVNDAVNFISDGALPTGLTEATIANQAAAGRYYVIASGLTPSEFKVSATQGGASVSLSGTQSGNHDVRNRVTGAISSVSGAWVSIYPPDDDQDFITFFDRLLGYCPQIKYVVPVVEPAGPGIYSHQVAVNYTNWLTDIVHDNWPSLLVLSTTLEPDFHTIPVTGYYWKMWDYRDDIVPDGILWHGYATLALAVHYRARRMMPLIFTFGFENIPLIDEEGGWYTDGQKDTTDGGVDHEARAAHVVKWLALHWDLGAEIAVWYGCAGLGWGTLQSTTGVDDPAAVAYRTGRTWFLGCTERRPGLCTNNADLDTTTIGIFWMDYDLPVSGTARFVWEEGGAASAYATSYSFQTDVAGTKTAVVAGSVTLPTKGRPLWLTAT